MACKANWLTIERVLARLLRSRFQETGIGAGSRVRAQHIGFIPIQSAVTITSVQSSQTISIN
jgi:hypothetical protein